MGYSHIDLGENRATLTVAALDSMSRLLKAMRNDLGLEIAIEDIDSLHGTDEEAPIKVVPSEGEGTPRAPEDS